MADANHGTDTPTLGRFVATELLWWVAWSAVSFLVGWDINDQLRSTWFWVAAGRFIATAITRWRRLANTAPAAAKTAVVGDLNGYTRSNTAFAGQSPARISAIVISHACTQCKPLRAISWGLAVDE